MDINPTPTGGVDMGIDIDKPLTPPAGSPETPGGKFLESIPEVYRQKDWAQKLAQHDNPHEEFYKQFDNQVSLIGRKTEGVKVPGETATAEEWSTFHKSIGVPDTVDGYSYQLTAEVPEHLKPHVAEDHELIKVMKEAALAAGVRPDGFKKLTDAFDNYYINKLDASLKEMETNLNRLQETFTNKFGEKSGQILKNWEESVAGLKGTEQGAIIDALDPRLKAVLAEQYHNFATKYISEDKLNLNVPSTAASGVMNATEYGEKYAELFAQVRSSKPGSPEHLSATKKLKELRERGAETIFKK